MCHQGLIPCHLPLAAVGVKERESFRFNFLFYELAFTKTNKVNLCNSSGTAPVLITLRYKDKAQKSAQSSEHFGLMTQLGKLLLSLTTMTLWLREASNFNFCEKTEKQREPKKKKKDNRD